MFRNNHFRAWHFESATFRGPGAPAAAFRRKDQKARSAAFNCALSFRRLPNVPLDLPAQTRVLTKGGYRKFVFDFSNFPEVAAGASLSNLRVTGPGGAVLTGLSVGTVVVLPADFTDSDGTVPAGEGVRVPLRAGDAARAGTDYVVECWAETPTGDLLAVSGRVAVRTLTSV